MTRKLATLCLAAAILGVRSGDARGDNVSFNYGKIKFEFAPPTEAGITFGGSSVFPPLPGDFFGPGSLPFDGLLPLDSGAVVVQVKESGEKGGTEDINIGVGELQECTISKSAPFMVHYGDGATEPWDVEVRLDPLETSDFEFDFTHNPPGEPDGGAILPTDSFVNVQAILTFTNTPPASPTRYRYFAIVDRTQLMTTDATWAHRHDSIAGGENRDFLPGADPADPSAPLQVLYFQGGGLDLPLRLVNVVPEPSVLVLLLIGAATSSASRTRQRQSRK
jgi:hypothetical protein